MPIEFLIIFFLGLEFGSFANVCIYRWPIDQSVMRPARSFCPSCKKKISWWENLPVLSYLFLRGRCSSCRVLISWRYPFNELLLPILWVGGILFFRKIGLPVNIPFEAAYCCFTFVLLVTTWTDLDWKIIPDNASILLALFGLGSSFWNPFFQDRSVVNPWLTSIVGGLVGGGILWLVAILGKLFFKKEAMGGGDIKLLAAFGTLLGWQGALSALFLASILGGLGAVIGLALKLIKRHEYIPFGPFLNAGALITFMLMCLRVSGGNPLVTSLLFNL